jgi:2-desacetyl-2-hydroxyethyl bacteriochlorophyllide A dehydrogenase
MRAAIIDKPNEIRIGEVPDPTPGPGEVVVKVGACGICGSDLNIAAGNFPPTPFPIVPGHEFAGEVVAVGAEVDYVAEGERVAVDPTLICGHCKWCRVGRGNLCDNWGATGDTVNGAVAEYVVVPAYNCHEIPDRMSFQQAAVVEPLSCAVHAIQIAPPRVGESVLVIGGGTMGLLTAQLLARGGAAELVVVDRKSERLPIASQLGADLTTTDLNEALEHRPNGYDLVVDATGAPAAIQSGLEAVAKGGRFLVVGVAPPHARVEISPFRVYNEEITVVGSMAVLHSYGPALQLVADGLVQVDPLITHSLPLDDYPNALQAVGRGEGLKIQLLPNVTK